MTGLVSHGNCLPGLHLLTPRCVNRLQLDIGIIAACAPTLRPLLGRFVNITQAIHGYRGAGNYYRAGKALDRLPVPPAAAARRHHHHHHRQNTIGSARIGSKGGLREKDEWGISSLNRGDGSFCGATTVVHAEHAGMRGTSPDSSDVERGLAVQLVEDDMILPLTENPEFKGIVKTTEFRIEK